jgi:hypothetical protein
MGSIRSRYTRENRFSHAAKTIRDIFRIARKNWPKKPGQRFPSKAIEQSPRIRRFALPNEWIFSVSFFIAGADHDHARPVEPSRDDAVMAKSPDRTGSRLFWVSRRTIAVIPRLREPGDRHTASRLRGNRSRRPLAPVGVASGQDCSLLLVPPCARTRFGVSTASERLHRVVGFFGTANRSNRPNVLVSPL